MTLEGWCVLWWWWRWRRVQVLLAGGFAASPFLQARVKQELAQAGLVGEVVICGRRPEAGVVSGEWFGGLWTHKHKELAGFRGVI